MSWCSRSNLRRCRGLGLPLLIFGLPAQAADFVLGAGAEADADGGLAESAFVDFAIGRQTWLSSVLSHSAVDIPVREDLDSWYADLSLDHLFDPVGVRAGFAYWGDPDVLDSRDWRGSLYWRGERFRVSGLFERRQFDFTIQAGERFPGREQSFDADGLGLSLSFELTSSVDVYLSGLDYDYSVDLQIDDRRELLRLLTASRLSLINSLVDFRVNAALGVDFGRQRLSLDVGTWRGETDGGDTRSATVRWLTPLGRRTDLELGIGYDDSELYGSLAFFSVFLFFYGG